MDRAQNPPYSFSCRRDEIPIPPLSTLIYSGSSQARGKPSRTLLARCESTGVELIRVTSVASDVVEFEWGRSSVRTCSLRDSASLDGFLTSLRAPIYLDITGLPVRRFGGPMIPRLVATGSAFRRSTRNPNYYARSEVPTSQDLRSYRSELCGTVPILSMAQLRRIDATDMSQCRYSVSRARVSTSSSLTKNSSGSNLPCPWGARVSD